LKNFYFQGKREKFAVILGKNVKKVLKFCYSRLLAVHRVLQHIIIKNVTFKPNFSTI